MKIVINTETTGLHPESGDEILQLSAVDFCGNVLFDHFFKPIKKESWPDAMKVNHITPEMLEDEQPFSTYKDQIQKILDTADELIGYNLIFDESMLEHQGIIVPNIRKFDVMREFAPIYGQYDEKRGDYRCVKLEACAQYYDFDFAAHNSLEDVRATLFCYKKINEDVLYKKTLDEETGFFIGNNEDAVFMIELKTYLDQIFRTDSLRKDFNDYTALNEVCMFSNEKFMKYKIKDRKKARALIREYITTNLPGKKISRIYKGALRWKELEDVDCLDDIMKVQLRKFLIDINESHELLMCVIHYDEYLDCKRIPCVHYVYYKDAKVDKNKLE